MDDDPNDVECTRDACQNVRNNLKVLIKTTQHQSTELQNLSRLHGEVETLRMKLVLTEEDAQKGFETSAAAVNAKEAAEAELKQLQSANEIQARKILILQGEADEAEKHKAQANYWREKYDSMGSLAETLDAKNLDVKQKYEDAVHLVTTVGKQLVNAENQVTNLKAANAEMSAKQKKLDKYLKSAIQVIDALSKTANVSKQTKPIKDLIAIFRRDDVRLFFNAPPWKNSSASQAAGIHESEEEGQDDADDGEEEEEEDPNLFDGTLDDDEDDAAVQKLEKMLTETIRESVETKKPLLNRPDFAPKMQELRARAKAPRVVQARNINKWPAGIKRPTKTSQMGILDERKVHARVVPVSDFDVINQVADTRRQAKLSGLRDPRPPTTSRAPMLPVIPPMAPAAVAVGAGASTIHGRKGKTVREQQAEMMKESIKDKVAKMKGINAGESASAPSVVAPEVAPETQTETQTPSTSEVSKPPSLKRHKSLRMSECTETDDEIDLEDEQPDQPAQPRLRMRSASVTAPRTRSVSRTSEGVRRSSRVAALNSKPSTPVKPKQPEKPENEKEPPSEAPTLRRSRSRSRAKTPTSAAVPSKTPPSLTPSASRAERARARSLIRGYSAERDEEEEQELELPPSKPPTVKEVVKRQVAAAMKRKAPAPAPIDQGPPIRTRGMTGAIAPRKKQFVAPSVEKEVPAANLDDTIAMEEEESQENPLDQTVVMEQEDAHQQQTDESQINRNDSEVTVVQDNFEHPPDAPEASPSPKIASEDLVAPVAPEIPDEPALQEPSDAPVPTATPAPPTIQEETPKKTSSPEKPKPATSPRTTKQLIVSKYGLELSDSEEEDVIPQYSPIYEREQSPPAPSVASNMPSCSTSSSVVKAEEPKPVEPTPAPSQSSQNDLLDDIISGAKSSTASVPKIIPPVALKKPEAPAKPADDLLGDILSGAKTSTKPPSAKPPTAPKSFTNSFMKPKEPVTAPPPADDILGDILSGAKISTAAKTLKIIPPDALKKPEDDLLGDILTGAKTSTKPAAKPPASKAPTAPKSFTNSFMKPKEPVEPATAPPPADDLLGDILSGAKSAKKPAAKPPAPKIAAKPVKKMEKKAEPVKTVAAPAKKTAPEPPPKKPEPKSGIDFSLSSDSSDDEDELRIEIDESPASSVASPASAAPAPGAFSACTVAENPQEIEAETPEEEEDEAEVPVEEQEEKGEDEKEESPAEPAPEEEVNTTKPPLVTRQNSEDKVVFKRRVASKPIAAPVVKRSSTAAKAPEAEDDFIGTILSGAKIQKKKATKRPATTSGAKKQPTDPIKRTRASASEEKETETPSSDAVENEATPEEDQPTTSEVAAPERRRGRPSKSPGPSTTSTASTAKMKIPGVRELAKNFPQRKFAKLATSYKAHFRQALDLKLGVNELKRPMEEKGITLGDSIPLTPSDAADVMMEFLRETSATDVWALMRARRGQNNAANLPNKDEENFLQVSVSLNEKDQELLEVFIRRIIAEFARRDSIDPNQCGRYARLFCHAVRFVDKSDEEKMEFTHRFFFVVLQKHAHQLIRILAFCLISDVSAYFSWLVEEIQEQSGFSVAFRVLLHEDTDQASTVNWLLSTKFECPYVPSVDLEDVKRAFRIAHDKFLATQSLEDDDEEKEENCMEYLKTSVYLAKTAHNGCLTVAFEMLQNEMTRLNEQFIQPHEAEKELKHRTVFTVPTVATKMTAQQAEHLKKEFQWQKCVLAVFIDNRKSDKGTAVINAFKKIAPEIVTLREVIESPTATENLLEHDAVEPLRLAIDFLSQLISECTNFPLISSTISHPTHAQN